MLMIDTNVLRQLSIYRKEIIAQSTVQSYVLHLV